MEFGPDVLKAVEGYEYVSLDLYDTLLLRPYVRPKDVFRHIELKENAPGFVQARVESERKCMLGPDTTTIDRIYEGMPEKFRRLKDKEFEYESNAVCPRRILETYRSIVENHKVVLVSDMYMPKDFLENLLTKNNIKGYLKLYVSSETGKSKDKGTMYGHIAEDLGIDKSQIIHVGDNAKSEYLVPKKLGFNSILVEKPRKVYFSKHRPIKRYYEKAQSLERSIIVGMDIIREWQDRKDEFWKDVSYRFGGPIVTDYVKFVADSVRDDDVILFAARDGFNLERVMNILHPERETHYVYVPRILNILIGSNFRQHNRYKRKIVESFHGKCEDPDAYYDEHEEELLEKRNKFFESYRDRMAGEVGNGKSLAIVDVTTMKYTSQKLVGDVFPDADILGVYYFLLFDDDTIPHKGYHVRDRMIKLLDNINITEFFMTSPEPPIMGLEDDGRPILYDPCTEEQCRLDIYDLVTAGETEYAKDVAKYFGDRMIDLGFKNVNRWLRILVNGSGYETRKNLSEMMWPVDAEHKTYISMVYHPRDTWFHIKKTVKDLMWYVHTKLVD